MEEQRRILEQMILEGADYIDVVEQSQLLDEYIVAHMKGSGSIG